MRARTVGELRASGWQVKSVKQELRDNLIARLQRGEPLFPGIVGYDESVVPQIENAILSGQDIVFLGERGQAKTRMARLLVNLLDEAVPALAGCEINDDPFAPICGACRARTPRTTPTAGGSSPRSRTGSAHRSARTTRSGSRTRSRSWRRSGRAFRPTSFRLSRRAT